MNKLVGFTSRPKQQMSFTLEDGSTVFMTLEYRPQQIGWFADIEWEDFELKGQRITASPNLLRQYRDNITFGLAIITAGNVEPLNATDFIDGTATVMLLNPADVLAVEAAAFEGN